MRALVLTDDGVRLDARYPDPIPQDGEVLVQIVRAGICETDLQLIQGYHGFRGVLGHEFVGMALDGALAGQRVVGEINCSCLACGTCLAGRANHCPQRTVVGIVGRAGAFADLLAIPERNLHPVPDELDTDIAVFTEPVAAAFQIPAQVDVARSDRIVVLGDGRLGNLCAQVLASVSDHVTVVGKHAAKLAALDALGIDTRLLDEATGGRDADIVVDCTGSATGLPTALSMVRPRGTIVLKTTIAAPHSLSLAPVVVDEVTIVGSRCGPFDRALDALSGGLVDAGGLIAARFSLSDGVRALSHAAEPGVLKVLLEM